MYYVQCTYLLFYDSFYKMFINLIKYVLCIQSKNNVLPINNVSFEYITTYWFSIK